MTTRQENPVKLPHLGQPLAVVSVIAYCDGPYAGGLDHEARIITDGRTLAAYHLCTDIEVGTPGSPYRSGSVITVDCNRINPVNDVACTGVLTVDLADPASWEAADDDTLAVLSAGEKVER